MNQSTSKRPPTRFQFSLFTILFIVLVVGGGIGFLGRQAILKSYRAREKAKLFRELKKIGHKDQAITGAKLQAEQTRLQRLHSNVVTAGTSGGGGAKLNDVKVSWNVRMFVRTSKGTVANIVASANTEDGKFGPVLIETKPASGNAAVVEALTNTYRQKSIPYKVVERDSSDVFDFVRDK